MFVKLPSLPILAAIQDSSDDVYIRSDGHQLFVVGPDDVLYMFIVEENLNELSEARVNEILQREILAS